MSSWFWVDQGYVRGPKRQEFPIEIECDIGPVTLQAELWLLSKRVPYAVSYFHVAWFERAHPPKDLVVHNPSPLRTFVPSTPEGAERALKDLVGITLVNRISTGQRGLESNVLFLFNHERVDSSLEPRLYRFLGRESWKSDYPSELVPPKDWPDWIKSRRFVPDGGNTLVLDPFSGRPRIVDRAVRSEKS